MAYRVEFTEHARRDLRGFDANLRERLIGRCAQLGENPRPAGCKALRGKHRGYWRVRVGKHRIVYAIDDEQEVVTIAWIGRRDEVYE